MFVCVHAFRCIVDVNSINWCSVWHHLLDQAVTNGEPGLAYRFRRPVDLLPKVAFGVNR